MASLRRRRLRVLTPRWAHDPLSGAGAAFRGGRYNRAGVAALYLAYDIDFAVNEYEQDIGTRPGTFCYYDVDLDPVADLTLDSEVIALGSAPADRFCLWKDLLSRSVTPPTWDLADAALAAGYVAAIVPSTVPANRPPARDTPGINVVIWRWNTGTSGTLVRALDPTNELPSDQSSWPP